MIVTGTVIIKTPQQLIATGNVVIETHKVDRYWERYDRDTKQLISTVVIVIERPTTVGRYRERCDRDSQKLIVTGNVIIETHNS